MELTKENDPRSAGLPLRSLGELDTSKPGRGIYRGRRLGFDPNSPNSSRVIFEFSPREAQTDLSEQPPVAIMAQDSGERVFLYIYDLSRGLARSMSPSLIGRQIDGIWHTSVVCYGYEFYYGQGIFVTDRVGQTQYGTPMEIKDMGVTELPQEVPPPVRLC